MSRTSNRSVHVVAATNPIYGAVNFLVLALPPGWRLVAGNIPPDVEKVVKHGRVQWVTIGISRSYAINRSRGSIVEITVKIREKVRKGVSLGDEYRVNGHSAFYALGEEKIGFIRRRKLDTIVVGFFCDTTNRYLEIKIRGHRLRGIAEEVLDYLRLSTCH